jgi:rod shape determining protein RodA
MRFDRQLIAHFEWFVPALTFGICAMGLATLYSATYDPSLDLSPLVARQLAWFGVGLLGMLVVMAVDYRTLERFAYVLYALAVIMLLLVPLVGVTGGGARRWLRLGPVTIQPSEPMKLLLIIALARFYGRVPVNPRGLGLTNGVIVPLALAALPCAAILLQPDLGTVCVIMIVYVSMAFVAGARITPFVTVFVTGLACGPILWRYLLPYQQQRILTFVNPEGDPLGAGYHVIQSRIAVGSGEFWGKGFLQGTQNQLHFLPEQHTDFIFSVFAEEWGFAGAMLLVGLYFTLLLRGFLIASRARDTFGGLLCAGVAAMIFWQVTVNVGMTTGLMPVVGIPLPFFSYGGSSLVTFLMGAGVIMNVQMRRFTFAGPQMV